MELDKDPIYVFVYGTLMEGERNAGLLVGARLVAKDVFTSEAKFLMQIAHSTSSKGKYTPTVKSVQADHPQASAIKGELYQVSEEVLEKLDELEKNGTLYNREFVDLKDVNEKAYMYLFVAKENNAENQQHRVIDSGNEQRREQSWRREGIAI